MLSFHLEPFNFWFRLLTEETTPTQDTLLAITGQQSNGISNLFAIVEEKQLDYLSGCDKRFICLT